ncbi:Hypothetical Protein XCAW_02469 [Xanthomonas citri subsp. citri Aw12879]|nr:Hypothetical Protein XCAW_01913 [Xanthomonas citri subsp. citri Aw12879]AGI08252.1 Hypothetical Protein XCAW_02469 [Xanthomonas citri subsp. citri Aw12879]
MNSGSESRFQVHFHCNVAVAKPSRPCLRAWRRRSVALRVVKRQRPQYAAAIVRSGSQDRLDDSRFPIPDSPNSLIAGAQSVHVQDECHAAVADQGGAGLAGEAAKGVGVGVLITKEVNLEPLLDRTVTCPIVDGAKAPALLTPLLLEGFH